MSLILQLLAHKLKPITSGSNRKYVGTGRLTGSTSTVSEKYQTMGKCFNGPKADKDLIFHTRKFYPIPTKFVAKISPLIWSYYYPSICLTRINYRCEFRLRRSGRVPFASSFLPCRWKNKTRQPHRLLPPLEVL